jgi:tripartite ATP-independent transporter DctP family solute receptor
MVPAVFSTTVAWGAEAEYSFIFGGSSAVDTLLDLANRHFIDLVTKRSKGRVEIKFFPADQLGGDIAQIESIMGGTQHLYGDVLVWLGNWERDFNIFGWGFTFRDSDHMAKFLKSPEYEEMVDRFNKKFGVKILPGAVPTEHRIFFSKNPVFSLEDIQGIKMRVPEIETYLRVWEALGTRPTRVTAAEIYMALRQGVVDACEFPVSAAYGDKFHEAGPHIVLTNHLISTYYLLMSGKAYESLPPDLKKVFDDTALETGEWTRARAEGTERETLDKMVEEGSKLTRIDMKPWREKILTATEAMEAKGLWSKGLYQKIQQIK